MAVTLVQALRESSGPLIGANRRRPSLHDLLGPQVGIAVKGAPAQPPEQYASSRRHQSEPIAGGDDPLPHVSDPIA